MPLDRRGTPVALEGSELSPQGAPRSAATRHANRETTMKRHPNSARNASMTPASRVPRPSAELDAYLAYLSAREPLSDTARMIIGQPTVEAA